VFAEVIHGQPGGEEHRGAEAADEPGEVSVQGAVVAGGADDDRGYRRVGVRFAVFGRPDRLLSNLHGERVPRLAGSCARGQS
jgi:hypothetical protein